MHEKKDSSTPLWRITTLEDPLSIVPCEDGGDKWAGSVKGCEIWVRTLLKGWSVLLTDVRGFL